MTMSADDFFDLIGKEADRQERQNNMADLICDMDDYSVTEIVAECVKQFGVADAAEVVAEMTCMARRSTVGDDALEVLTRTIN
jgi:hypothetical protein